MKPEDKAAWLQAGNNYWPKGAAKDLGEYMFEAGMAHRESMFMVKIPSENLLFNIAQRVIPAVEKAMAHRDAQPAVAVNEQLIFTLQAILDSYHGQEYLRNDLKDNARAAIAAAEAAKGRCVMGTLECKEFESTEIIRISPEGEVCINWPVVEQHAAKWQKGCTDVHIGYSLALIAARGQHAKN